MNNHADISKKFKCSRCKKDLREDAKNPCSCAKEHLERGSKSGNKFMKTIIDYEGDIK